MEKENRKTGGKGIERNGKGRKKSKRIEMEKK